MKKKFPLIIFIVGLAALASGVTFLLFNLLSGPKTADVDFLVEVGAWTEEGTDEAVIWTFSEIGQGTLTTNGHQNEYDFIWAMEGQTLKMETKWLYDLENEYTYSLNQGDKKLELTDSEGKVVTFIPATIIQGVENLEDTED